MTTGASPHVHGKTDADAVFGMIYAQAEDDFNRIETNYLNAMGRLAEAEGEAEIYRDLRMKLFIDPADLKAKYAASPGVAEDADERVGRRPELLPAHPPGGEAARHHAFEPWMALSFSEGSIGGDIEKVALGPLEAFYGKTPRAAGVRRTTAARCRRSRPARTASPSRRRSPRRSSAMLLDQPAHVVLLPLGSCR